MSGFSYGAAASGTINVPSGVFVKTISAHASAAATLTIGGGASIPLPGTSSAPVGFGEDYSEGRELLPGPVTIVATGTDAIYVSWGP